LPEVTGGCAVLVNPGDCDSIAEGIRNVVHDDGLRRSLCATGLAHVRKFSWDQTATDTSRILSDFLPAASPVRARTVAEEFK
jgi:alpha-1,3-rhamnosyl/mannosyltransferase